MTGGDSSDFALKAEGVSKKFLLGRRSNSLKDRLTGISERNRDEFWAFSDISVTVPRGTMLGVIGRNGSGKSTFLRTLCGVYRPTSGRILVNGRVTALLELGAGFHPDLTGRENIYMNGAVVGLDRDYMDDVMDEVIEMADIGSFIDAPIDTYSSGMRARLGFAVSVQMQPEILLADEITAVGDIAFQTHGVRRMNELREGGATIVQVSHSLPMLRKNCDQILWLHHGQMRRLGDPDEVIDEYTALAEVDKSGRMIGGKPKKGPAPGPAKRQAARQQAAVAQAMAADDQNSAWFTRVSFSASDSGDLVAGSPAVLSVELAPTQQLVDPKLEVAVLAAGGRPTGFGYRSSALAVGGEEFLVEATVGALTLTTGQYFLRVDVISNGEVVATRHERIAVKPPEVDVEFAELDARWGIASPKS